MSCTNAYFSGWGDCASLLEKMNGGILQKKGATAWTDTTIGSATAWHSVLALINDDTRDAIALPVLYFENTSDDVEIITSPLGKSSIGSTPIPRGVIYLDASICDYKYLHSLTDTWFEFFPTFQGNSMWATRITGGTLKGFRCKLGFKAGLPPEDKNQSFPMYIFFDSYSEFEDVVQVDLEDMPYSDLFDYVPAALSMHITTAYAAKEVIVKIQKRGSGDDPATLLYTDFSVLKDNTGLVVTVDSVVPNGNGSYTLTITKMVGETATTLAAGEWVIIQAHDEDSVPIYLTYISNSLKILVA